jgi:hypothetical protein
MPGYGAYIPPIPGTGPGVDIAPPAAHTATFDKARQIATRNYRRALCHTRGDRVTGVGSGLGHVSAGIRHRSRLARTSPGRIHRRLHAWVLRIPVHLSSRLWRLRSQLLSHHTATASTVTSVLLAGLPMLGLRRNSLRSPSAHTPVSRHAPWHVVLRTAALHVGRHSGLHSSSWVLWRVATRGHRPTCRSAHRSAHEAWRRPSRKARHRPSRRTWSGHGRHRATRHADRRVLHGWRLRSTGASRHCRSSVPTDDSAGTVVRGDVRVVAMFWLTVQHRHRFHSSLHKGKMHTSETGAVESCYPDKIAYRSERVRGGSIEHENPFICVVRVGLLAHLHPALRPVNHLLDDCPAFTDEDTRGVVRDEQANLKASIGSAVGCNVTFGGGLPVLSLVGLNAETESALNMI